MKIQGELNIIITYFRVLDVHLPTRFLSREGWEDLKSHINCPYLLFLKFRVDLLEGFCKKNRDSCNETRRKLIQAHVGQKHAYRVCSSIL